MAQLVWSPDAIQDLNSICAYIARNSERYAGAFVEHVTRIVESIPDQPLLGSVVPEYERPDLRERLYQNYRIVYRLRGDLVEIVTITHGARRLPVHPPP
jgi:toxin ParE1/3/4